jgi:hypothetical protein
MRALTPSALSNDQKELKEMGMRGTEALLFLSLIALVLVVSMLTTIASLVIIVKLRLFPNMELMTFTRDSHVLFHGDTDLDRVHLYNNQIRGVGSISGEISLEAGDSYLSISSKGIEVSSPEGFQIKSKKSGKTIFPPDFGAIALPSIASLSVPGGAKNVHKVRSPIDQDLGIYARERIKIRGNEGVDIDSKEITFTSVGLYMSSVNASIVLEGAHGVTLNMDSLELPPKGRDDAEAKTGPLQYKLCICGKSGRVFRLQLKHGANHCGDVRFPESINPCI